MKKLFYLAIILSLGAGTMGCRQDMRDQEKYEPLEYSPFFGDKLSARQPVEGTIARGWLKLDKAYWDGIGDDEKFINEVPQRVLDRYETFEELVLRGQERFNIYCSTCHDRGGTGNGMIVRRGYKKPPSFHEERLRQQPLGYFYNVITHGFAVMPDYAAQIKPDDRWAVAAYLRTLQLTQYASKDLVPEEHLKDLEE